MVPRPKDLLLGADPREPSELQNNLTASLRLLGANESPRVLEKLDQLLSARRARVKRVATSEAHQVAIVLAAVIGHQLRKHGWQWVELFWREPPVEPLVTYDPSRESAERWGVMRVDRGILVLPIYDLLYVQLHRRTPIAIAAGVERVLAQPAEADDVLLARLSDAPSS